MAVIKQKAAAPTNYPGENFHNWIAAPSQSRRPPAPPDQRRRGPPSISEFCQKQNRWADGFAGVSGGNKVKRCLSHLMKIVAVWENEKAAATVKNVAKLSRRNKRGNSLCCALIPARLHFFKCLVHLQQPVAVGFYISHLGRNAQREKRETLQMERL